MARPRMTGRSARAPQRHRHILLAVPFDSGRRPANMETSADAKHRTVDEVAARFAAKREVENKGVSELGYDDVGVGAPGSKAASAA